MLTASLLALSAAGSALGAVVPRWQHALSCSDLWDKAPQLLSDLDIYIAEDVPGASLVWSLHANLAYRRLCSRHQLDDAVRDRCVSAARSGPSCLLPLRRIHPHEQQVSAGVRHAWRCEAKSATHLLASYPLASAQLEGAVRSLASRCMERPLCYGR